MNKELATAIEHGIDAGAFEHEKGFCLRAMREGAEKIYGSKYDRLFRGNGTNRDATAARAGHRFLDAGLGFLTSEVFRNGGLQPGDLLVKTQVAQNHWGDYSGHIGCLMLDYKRVGENSSTSTGRVHGALGFRTLAEFGHFDIVVRLPRRASQESSASPAPIAKPVAAAAALPPRMVIHFEGTPLKASVGRDTQDRAVARIRDVFEEIDFVVTSDAQTGIISITKEKVS